MLLLMSLQEAKRVCDHRFNLRHLLISAAVGVVGTVLAAVIVQRLEKKEASSARRETDALAGELAAARRDKDDLAERLRRSALERDEYAEKLRRAVWEPQGAHESRRLFGQAGSASRNLAGLERKIQELRNVLDAQDRAREALT